MDTHKWIKSDDTISEAGYDHLVATTFDKVPNCSNFGLFVKWYTHFLQSFRGYGSKLKIFYFVLECTGNQQINKLRADNN